MITPARCPYCQDLISIPAGQNAEALVQCPLCHEQYPLGKVLDELPPSLVVLKEAPLQVARQELKERKEQEPITVVSQQERSRARGEQRFEVGATNSNLAAARRERTATARKNPAWEVAKIALGALLAIPLAQLILWWLPGSWQRDPLNLGPTVGRYAPIVVPANLRDEQPAAQYVAEPRRGSTERQQQVEQVSERIRQAVEQQLRQAEIDAESDASPSPDAPLPSSAPAGEAATAAADAPTAGQQNSPSENSPPEPVQQAEPEPSAPEPAQQAEAPPAEAANSETAADELPED